jgi:hypothetical protein
LQLGDICYSQELDDIPSTFNLEQCIL